jgi:hypothetical protein
VFTAKPSSIRFARTQSLSAKVVLTVLSRGS